MRSKKSDTNFLFLSWKCGEGLTVQLKLPLDTSEQFSVLYLTDLDWTHFLSWLSDQILDRILTEGWSVSFETPSGRILAALVETGGDLLNKQRQTIGNVQFQPAAVAILPAGESKQVSYLLLYYCQATCVVLGLASTPGYLHCRCCSTLKGWKNTDEIEEPEF